MQRMQRLTEAKSPRKKPRLQTVTTLSSADQRPVHLLLAEMRRTNDASLVYKSPLATAIEYAQDCGGTLLRNYTAVTAKEPLWSVQRDAVDFMKRRESDFDGQGCAGGMLCDEMGLGKTKDALVTILEQNQAWAQQTQRRFNGPTLVVCRHILIKNWINELQAFPREAFEYAVLTTTSRNHSTDSGYFTRCCDLVFTTYSTVQTTFAKHRSRLAAAAAAAQDEDDDNNDDDALYNILFGVEWRRVVADEAHVFVVETTASAEAMMALRAHSKWVLTGTPVQNSRSDIVTFLRFNGLSGVTDDVARLRAYLQHMMLRRTRQSLVGMENIPVFKPVDRRIQQVHFTPAEQMLYYLYAKYALLRGNGQSHAVKTTQMIQMMRQLCLCPTMLERLARPCGLRVVGEPAVEVTRRHGRKKHVTDNDGVTLEAYFAQWDDDADLCIKYSDEGVSRCELEWRPRYPYQQKGDKKYYRTLRRQWEESPEAVVTADPEQPQEKTEAMVRHMKRHALRLDQPSSKEAAIVNYIRHTPQDDKIIVYSNYVGFLVSLNHWLQVAGFRTVLVTGQTNKKDMNDALLDEFDCNPCIRVLLITLKLGGEGLNIAVANHVLFADPWWNPSILEQAEHRVQRASQEKEISVVYFIVKDTIEEHMLKHLANKKTLLPSLLEEAEETEELDERAASLLFNYRVDIVPRVA